MLLWCWPLLKVLQRNRRLLFPLLLSLAGVSAPMSVAREITPGGWLVGCTYNEQRGSRAMFEVCTASARMRRTTSPDLVTTYDAKVPSATPSSPVVASVPVSAMATSVFAHSAEEGRSDEAERRA